MGEGAAFCSSVGTVSVVFTAIFCCVAAGICIPLLYAYSAVQIENISSSGKENAEEVFVLALRTLASGNIVEFGIYPVLLFRRGLGRL